MLYSNHNGLTICAYNVIIYAWCLIQKEQHLTPVLGWDVVPFLDIGKD